MSASKVGECNPRDALFEFVVERFIVEEDVGIPIAAIEPVFYLADALHCASQIRVAGQNDEAGICSSSGR